jgi:hypothetical protein
MYLTKNKLKEVDKVAYTAWVVRCYIRYMIKFLKELDDPAVSALGERTWKLSNVRKGQSSDG